MRLTPFDVETPIGPVEELEAVDESSETIASLSAFTAGPAAAPVTRIGC